MWGALGYSDGLWSLICPCLPASPVGPREVRPKVTDDSWCTSRTTGAPEEKEAIVDGHAAGSHLFTWALRQWPFLGSHQHAKALARQGRLQVNGSSVADFHHLSAGDHVTLRLDPHVLSLNHTFVRHHIVAREQQGMRLEAFCKSCFHEILTSRRSIREAVKEGCVTVNGEQVEHTRVLQEGASVQMSLPAIQALHALCPKNCWPRIIYEDDMLAVVWKNANVKSMGGWQTAENGARLQVKASSRSDAFDERLKSIHRLDKPVAGLMLMAKTYSAHRSLMQWLKERKNFSKMYRAIVFGDPTASSKASNEAGQFRVEVPIDGKEALTLGRTLEEVVPGFHVVELSLITGRRHQLRIHMASLGCPIVGDTEYGSKTRIPGGILLAALALKFLHPERLSQLEFHEEEPQHFKSWRQKMYSGA
eukprot:Skav235620  [mRNA]  locus=scaffold358:203576:204835:+ [translate_table: standard]